MQRRNLALNGQAKLGERAVLIVDRARGGRYETQMTDVEGHSKRLAWRRRLERFARNPKIFPGGEHETANCAACARIIVARFGGEVRGYYHDDNPAARVGELEYGHDFAITAERFLVDPWLFHYYGETPVLDLARAPDRAEALARYGPEEKWEGVPGPPLPGKTRRVHFTP